MSDTVQTILEGGVGIVTLNRPAVLNAVNAELRDAFIAAMRMLNRDEAVRAVVITGSGDRAFCAGQDLEASSALDGDNIEAWLRAIGRFYQAIRDMDKPVVAALNGVAAGAGFQVALHCDMRVAHPEITLSQPEVDAGLPSVIGTMIMREILGLSRSTALGLSCRRVEAEEALRYGLLSRIVPRGEVLLQAVGLARQLGAKPPIAVRLTKQRIRAVTQAAFDDAIEAGIRLQREAYAAGEPQAAAARFLARRRQH
jgi:enoyl-CoA hydratase